MAKLLPAFEVGQGKQLPVFSALVRRQVPQVAVAYAGVGWGLVQFVDWLTNRYALSSSLTDFVAYLVVLFVPTMLILAYCRGGEEEHWTWWEKIGVPVNLLVAAVVLWANFQGKELGSINQTVTIQDSSGRTVQREVPKSAFRKRLALAYFENASSDKNLDWLRQGIAIALQTDLSQDLYLSVQDSYDYSEKLKEVGFSYKDPLPLGLERRIANYYGLNYIVTGTFSKKAEEYIVRVDLYDAARVKRLTRRTYKGPDLFDLLDDLSVQLKRDVEVPEQHIQDITDFPVTEVLTRSLPAFEHYTRAKNLREFDGDYSGAMTQLDQAIAADPSFAMAHLEQVESALLAGHPEKSERAYQQAEHYAFKLTERSQFILKSGNWVNGRSEEADRAAQQWAALYPDDLKAQLTLAKHYLDNNQWPKAIDAFRRMIELDPGEAHYLSKIAEAQLRLGRTSDAITTFQQYGEQSNDRPGAYEEIADIYRTIGQFDRARSYYRQAAAINTDDLSPLIELATTDMLSGQLDAAYKQYRALLARARRTDEKRQIYSRLQQYYSLRGQWKQAIAELPVLSEQISKTSGPINSFFNQAIRIDSFVEAGQPEVAFATLARLQGQTRSNFLLKGLLESGYLKVYLALEDPDRAEPLIGKLEQLFRRYGQAHLMDDLGLVAARGKVAELRRDYRQALGYYQQFLKNNPTEIGTNLDIGRCYRLSGQLSEAQDALQKALQVAPADPEIHYELAEVAQARQDSATALKEVQIALQILQPADESDKRLKEAKALLAKLQAKA